jgi:hypothetical protein
MAQKIVQQQIEETPAFDPANDPASAPFTKHVAKIIRGDDLRRHNEAWNKRLFPGSSA